MFDGELLPHRSHIFSHSQGCRGGNSVPANAVVIEQCEAPNGNATSLPAWSSLTPGANDYCYSRADATVPTCLAVPGRD